MVCPRGPYIGHLFSGRHFADSGLKYVGRGKFGEGRVFLVLSLTCSGASTPGSSDGDSSQASADYSTFIRNSFHLYPIFYENFV